MEMKKIVLNKLCMELMSCFMWWIKEVFVRIEFIMKVFNVVEKFVLDVRIIILKYKVSVIMSNILFVRYLESFLKILGKKKMFYRN